MRNLDRKFTIIILSIWIIAGVSFHLYTAAFGVLESWLQRLIHISWVFPIAFMCWPVFKSKEETKVPIYDWILVVLSVIPGIYGIVNYEEISYRIFQVDEVTNIQLTMASLFIFTLMEATRRLLGWPLTIICLFFGGYMLFGEYFPGIMRGSAFTYREVVESLFLTTDGIFSIPLGVSATYVVIFLIFGAFLEVSGIGPWFMEFSSRVAGKSVGGPAKIAVVSSCLFGSISGSAVANVYSTGNFTIPMMKRVGFRPSLAGGIETMASTGGQIMPPLMGAGAFVMSAYLGVEYKLIIVAALIPALAYYGTALMMIHLIAKKDGFRGLKEEELPRWSDVLKRSFLLLPILVLVIALMMGKTPMLAGLIAIILAWAVSFFNGRHKMGPKGLYEAFMIAGRSVPVIAVACGAAGIVIGSIALTGIGFKIGALIASLSGNSGFIGLFLIAILAVIFGMGLPTTSAYIIAAALGVSSLTSHGFEPLAAHMFIFYFAVLSNMTPPVALAAFAASTIAVESPMKIAVTAMKIGVVAFIIPFAFVYDLGLLSQGSALNITWSVITMSIASLLLSIGFAGFLKYKLNAIARIFFLLSGLIIFFPYPVTEISGMVAGAALIFFFTRESKVLTI